MVGSVTIPDGHSSSDMTRGGWEPRLASLLGAAADGVTRSHLQALVAQTVREDADIEFKARLYGTSDKQKRDLAADVAALANERGGVIVLGVAEEDGVASGLCPVEVSENEELRMRQIVASSCAPHVAFEIHRVRDDPDAAGNGFFLLVVPPSAARPHSVQKGVDLRFPRRDGALTRYMTESEVAQLYRDRLPGRTMVLVSRTCRPSATNSRRCQARRPP
jgi:predicted HTH transcriptional regulator